MEVRPHRRIYRKKTKKIKVGNVSVGGNSQISVQSMTNTLTTDITATINQIHLLEEAGADLVRVSCPDEDSTKALKKITKEVKVPIIDRFIGFFMCANFFSNSFTVSMTGNACLAQDGQDIIFTPLDRIPNDFKIS